MKKKNLENKDEKRFNFYFFTIAPNSRIAPSTSSWVWSDSLRYWKSCLFSSSALFAASVCALISSFSMSSSLWSLARSSSFLLSFDFLSLNLAFSCLWKIAVLLVLVPLHLLRFGIYWVPCPPNFIKSIEFWEWFNAP